MAITGTLAINKTSYPSAYIKIMSFNHIPDSDDPETYVTYYTYNSYADSEKDTIVQSGLSSFRNDLTEMSFSRCYQDLKKDCAGFLDC